MQRGYGVGTRQALVRGRGPVMALCKRGIEQWPEISSHAARHGPQSGGFAQRRVLKDDCEALLYLRHRAVAHHRLHEPNFEIR